MVLPSFPNPHAGVVAMLRAILLLLAGSAAPLLAQSGASLPDPHSSGPTQQDLSAAAASSDWLYATHDYAGQRYVTLDQVTPKNAARLRPVCAYQASELGSFQTHPLVHAGVMYLTTRRATIAIDAATCREKWRQSLGKVGEAKSTLEFFRTVLPNRGAALKEGLLVRGTPDGRLVAHDAVSGSVRWDRIVADSSIGEMFTMPPLIFEDLVLIGPAASEAGVRGWIGAFRLSDGEPVWKFYTVPDSGAPGSETWHVPSSIKHGGGAVWTPFSLDPDAGLLFVAAGNPAPDFAKDLRPGANLYTNSLVVLDARTGALQWYRQLVPSDFHDWDFTQAGPLFSTRIGGVARQLIAAAGKDGILRVLDRETHEPLYELEVSTRANVDVPLSKEWLRVCPGYLGGVEWNGPAYHPRTDLLYVPSVDWCNYAKLRDSVTLEVGGEFFAGDAELDSLSRGAGWLTAVEAGSGKVRWRYRSESPLVAAVTTTSAGVLFTGDTDGDFLAMDARTGRVLYRFHTGGALGGGVLTYAVGGKQYVAATSGSLPIFKRTTGSATLFVFALP
jgi:alcohol dehydrogenase (cytochrome c)